MSERRELMAKAKAFTVSIGKLGKDERSRNPSGTFGADYNRLRALVLKAFPHLESVSPPDVTIERDGLGSGFTVESYGELDTFSEQLLQLLAEQSDAKE